MSEPSAQNRSLPQVHDVLVVPTYSCTEKDMAALGGVQRSRLALDSHLWVGHYRYWKQIMDACEPAGYSRANVTKAHRWQPTRQFAAYYSIVNTNPHNPREPVWDTDVTIRRAVMLSRLVFPTATGLEYAARSKLNEQGELEKVIPFPGQLAYTVTDLDQKLQRHCLKKDEWLDVSNLLKRWQVRQINCSERIKRALWYNEKAAFESQFADRVELLVRTAECLWGPDWNGGGRGAPFRAGLVRLADYFKLQLDLTQADEFWTLRARVTHGRGFPRSERLRVDEGEEDEWRKRTLLYGTVEEVLRRTLRHTIEDDSFAAVFESGETVSEWLRNTQELPPPPMCKS